MSPQVFTGEQITVYRALALRKGLELYERTGVKPNTRWTPGAMLKAATSITGKKYLRGQYGKAIYDLSKWLADYGYVEEGKQ